MTISLHAGSYRNTTFLLIAIIKAYSQKNLGSLKTGVRKPYI
jgi:hypothetical protein